MYRKGDVVKLMIDEYNTDAKIISKMETFAKVMFIERYGDLYRMTLKWRTQKHTIPIKGYTHTKVFTFKDGWSPMCDYYIGHNAVHHHNPIGKVHVYVCPQTYSPSNLKYDF